MHSVAVNRIVQKRPQDLTLGYLDSELAGTAPTSHLASWRDYTQIQFPTGPVASLFWQ